MLQMLGLPDGTHGTPMVFLVHIHIKPVLISLLRFFRLYRSNLVLLLLNSLLLLFGTPVSGNLLFTLVRTGLRISLMSELQAFVWVVVVDSLAVVVVFQMVVVEILGVLLVILGDLLREVELTTTGMVMDLFRYQTDR